MSARRLPNGSSARTRVPTGTARGPSTTRPPASSIALPASGARDNAADNAAADVADDVLGEHAEDGVTDADRGLSPDEHHHREHGDLHQPRTGAEQPWDPEDLVHARGEDATTATLAQAE